MRGTHGRWLAASAAAACAVACAAAAGLAASPAAAVTNLYAAQQPGAAPGALAQFAVGPSGALTPLAPAALGSSAQDLAITPDGSFAYVTLSSGTDAGALAEFARGADGRMTTIGTITGLASDPRGILVNPQGTRAIYVNVNTPAVRWRPIGAGGALGAETAVSIAGEIPRFLAMNPSGTSLYVGTAGGASGTGILQFDVDAATGTIAAKAVAFVAWPGAGGAPAEVARMAISPDGRHLYATSGEASGDIARFDIDPSGALGGGTLIAVPDRGSAVSVIAIGPGGLFAWAPTSATAAPPGRIYEFARDPSTGGLATLAPASAPYTTADVAAHDAVPSPNGSSLYVGQVANVGHWPVTGAGTLLSPANFTVGGAANAGIALRPSQAPVASFTATPAVAGSATTFDASASSDPDGTVSFYDWDFGDGSALGDGGPTPSHVYASAGARTVTLTVTDADGTSTRQLWTGSRMLRNGGPSAQTTRTVDIAAAPAPPPPLPPPPPPPPPPAPPAPDKGTSVTIVRVSGTVLVKVPGSKRYVDVTTLREIPLGSRIDARKGQVRLTAEVNATTHQTQSSLFYAGIFQALQTKGSKPILEAKMLGGTFASCARSAASGAVARSASAGAFAPPFQFAAKRKRSKRVVRRLWGKGKGDFRTSGRRSTATVRGTWWLVEDRCDGTLTRVREGFVDVRDLRLKRTIRLRAGKRSLYLAKAP